jgi:TolB protein
VTGIGKNQIPIALNLFVGQGSNLPVITDVVASDLERSGQFKSTKSRELITENDRPNLLTFRNQGVEALVVGSIIESESKRYKVSFRLWDVAKNEDLGAKSFFVSESDLRLSAHVISDFVFEQLTGEKGSFATKIAFVSKFVSKYALWISDIDGENAKSALSSPEPIISPSWSRDGKQVAYVSFESRKPVVFVHNIAEGTRKVVADFKGSNSAPAWSPDGKYLVVALADKGLQQLYAIDLSGGKPKKLFESLGIDTEPTFSQDGLSIYFVSDRSGSPQVYRGTVASQQTERITFNGSYNTSPSISSDGKFLAYISKQNEGYKLFVMNLVSGISSAITDTNLDERPSFAPNGKLIIYATKENGKHVLMTTTLDGQFKSRLAAQLGDTREPNWGP